MNPIERYTADFRSLNGSAPTWLRQKREAAWSRFIAAGFPTVRSEEWKYTNIATLAKTEFALAGPADAETAADLVAQASLPAGAQLVFVHGVFVAELSRSSRDAAVEVMPLETALRQSPELVSGGFGQLVGAEPDAFVDLNTAMARNGAVVRIARHSTATEPIHLIFVSPPTDQPVASHPYVMVVAEEDSEATLVETYLGSDSCPYLVNAVTEVFAEQNARLRHYRVQREGAQGFHVANFVAHQARDSRLASVVVSLGAQLSRVNISTVLDGEGSECTLDGLYLATAHQHVDHHTSIDHQKPHSTSRELYKGILDQHATGVFNGKVYVRPHALKSDAQQMNKNLLLSDDAEVDTKPQLEIFADDVKCSHGATIGRLEENALFFLRARGIDAATARNLLIYAFANELVARIEVAPVRDRLSGVLEERFGLPGAGGGVG